jgi:mannosyl-oligosaccharide alpha-1,2-mannosidase
MLFIRRWVFVLLLATCALYAIYKLSYFTDRLEYGGFNNPQTPATPAYSQPAKVVDGRFYWSDRPIQYPVSSFIPLPSGRPLRLPRVQHDFPPESASDASVRRQRQTDVKRVFEHCWTAYKDHAWMKDEVAPISGASLNTFGGWAATLVDTLDTLWIMDMREDFHLAVLAVTEIDFTISDETIINIFETTIRYLGGLLAAYDLSGEKALIDKAVELGDMLYVAFDTPNRMPATLWDFQKARAVNGETQLPGEGTSIAEIGSLSVEFTRLSQITKDQKWFDAIQRISEILDQQQNTTHLPGMWPVFVNAKKQLFNEGSEFTLGGRSDSLYEYFPKTYALLGGLSPIYEKLYRDSMATAIKYSFFRPMAPDNADVLLSGNLNASNPSDVRLNPRGQHLSCFAGGMLALGGRLFNDKSHVDIARKLVDGCIWAYKAFPLGIMSETFHVVACNCTTSCDWDEKLWHEKILEKAGLDSSTDVAQFIEEERLPTGITEVGDRRYILRPEAIESIFILYRVTGDRKLQDIAWEIFISIEKFTHTDIANAGLSDVTVKDGKPPKIDRMESFWLSETLKYFYLIFSEPSLISLDDYVLNTEAHPLRRPQ